MPAEQAGNPALQALGVDQARERAAVRRQHGRQGNALRHRRLGAVRRDHHRRLLRRGQRDARLVHAARRPGAAGADAARRGGLRRRRLRPVRHAGLRHPGGVHRRADDRPHAGVPGQEDRGLRDEDGVDRDPGHAGAGAGRHRARGDGRRRARPASPTRARTASPRSCTRFTSAGNNNGSAFAGLSANTPFYNVAAGRRDVVRPLRRDRAGARHRRLAGGKKRAGSHRRHDAHARPAVRRAAGRHGAAGRRAELRAGAGPRPGRRAPAAVVRNRRRCTHRHRTRTRHVTQEAFRCSTPRWSARRSSTRSASSTRARSGATR